MKIEHQVKKSFRITEVDRVDLIEVVTEDMEPGKGKIIITCFGKAWTAYWGGMNGGTVSEFIRRCDNDYLMGYFAPTMNSTIDAVEDDLEKVAKKRIFKLRRNDDVTKAEARELYEMASDELHCAPGNEKAMCAIFGEEWWMDTPQVDNHEYIYVCRIIDAVRDAFKQIAGEPDDLVLLPRELTAENGAKALLRGEFSEPIDIRCPVCVDIEDSESCEECNGTGEVTYPSIIAWTTIKDIYAKVVKHYA